MNKYDLVGIDGNAFFILSYVCRCMKKEKCSQEEIDNYLKDAKSSGYDHLLYVSMIMIDNLNER